MQAFLEGLELMDGVQMRVGLPYLGQVGYVHFVARTFVLNATRSSRSFKCDVWIFITVNLR